MFHPVVVGLHAALVACWECQKTSYYGDYSESRTSSWGFLLKEGGRLTSPPFFVGFTVERRLENKNLFLIQVREWHGPSCQHLQEMSSQYLSPRWFRSSAKSTPEGRPGMSDVSPLSEVSGLLFDSTSLSPLLFFCLVLLLFLSYFFCLLVRSSEPFPENSSIFFVKIMCGSCLAARRSKLVGGMCSKLPWHWYLLLFIYIYFLLLLSIPFLYFFF